MTEREIIESIFEIYDRDWGMIHWWGTISFGLVAVAQLEIEKLNIYLLTLIILLYSLFTGWIGLEYLFNVQVLTGFNADLAELGEAAHKGSHALLNSRLVYKGVALQDAAVCTTYFASMGFLIYSYVARTKQ